MAKAYQALVDVSIPKPVAKVNPEDENSDWVTEGATYPAGSLISEEWLTPRDRKRAENGELEHLLRASDEEIPDGYVTGGSFNAPERGVFIAEHEAERTALEAGGHIVIPDQQKMELLSSSAKHDREYMERVKEAGLDQRPVLEHLQQERPRVPDEMLYGRETGAGVQHFRGQEGNQEEALQEVRDSQESAEESNSDNNSEVATRPAPGSSSENDDSGQQQAEPQTVTGG